jgi:thiamine biosynthesis lipoprotein
VTTATARSIVQTFTAFGGARCELIVCDATAGDVSRAVADVSAFERALTRFDTRSELSRFNAAAGARVPVSSLLGELLRVCLDAHALSDGLVNAACLPALVAAGYDRSITAVLRHPGFRGRATARPPVPHLPEVLEVGAGWARLAPGCAVDLGGVGKGWLADRLCERFDNAAINLGGDVRTRGEGPESVGWAVALCDGCLVTVTDAGVATSGITGRCWSGGHHLIDPRTALPARTDITAVSVVAENALRAEVLAKSACLVGAAAADVWLATRGSACHALILNDGAPTA